MRFDYYLDNAGWSRAELTVGENTIRLTASYLSDALADLLRAALEVIGGAQYVEFIWCEEPGDYRWRLDVRGSMVDIQIFAPEDIYRFRGWNDIEVDDDDIFDEDAPEVLVFSGTTGIHVFGTEVARAARSVLREFGEEGYLKRWLQFPFPTLLLQALDEQLADAPRE